LITGGRVQVNGQIVTTLGAKADPARDHIRVDGKLLQGPERPRYIVLNKPKGYVTTASDPDGRPTVLDLVRGGPRLFPVGRLDYSSEGLLLLTNDGPLANALTRAATGVEKTYLVKVSGHPSESALNQLRHGVMIDRSTQIRPRPAASDGVESESPNPRRRSTHDESARKRTAAQRERVMTAPARIRLIREAENPWYEMILTEGRNREIRKMFEEIGSHVEKIRRVGYGPLILDLEPGRSRELTLDEVAALRRAAEGRSQKPAKKMPRPGTTRPRRAGDRRPSSTTKPTQKPTSSRRRNSRPPASPRHSGKRS
jgi:23S rRNA pseudouridine2605 synthase